MIAMDVAARARAHELHAVAPLVVLGERPELVGACTVVSNGSKTVAFSSAELLRLAAEPLALVLTLDGKRTLQVASWALSRTHGLGIIELAAAFPAEAGLDVKPLDVGAVAAAVETRGAPAAIVAVQATEAGFVRSLVPVFVDAYDDGTMRDHPPHLASPQQQGDDKLVVDGSPLFAWLPADPVLGRGSEVVAVALAVMRPAGVPGPRALPPIAELVELADLGRVLPYAAQTKEASNDLVQVAGEIKERPEP
jgi:hypothetical protein